MVQVVYNDKDSVQEQQVMLIVPIYLIHSGRRWKCGTIVCYSNNRFVGVIVDQIVLRESVLWD